MKGFGFVFLLIFLTSISIFSQDHPSRLDDDFSNTTLRDWTWLHDTEHWPNKALKQEVKDGILILEPGTSGWFEDKNAPFLYKEVQGDFDVRSRAKATGLTENLSKTVWSLGGLMVRVPKPNGKEQWKPKEENWFFITTGVAEENGKQVIETKYTLNSKSNLKLRDAKTEWITMRIVRIGNVFLMLYRYDNDKSWVVHDRFYLVDWPAVLQVGFIAYTNSMAVPPNILWGNPYKFNNEVFDHLGKPDLRLTVDYIRFKKPKISFDIAGNRRASWLNQVYKNNLIDYETSNETVLKLIGE